jgi:hypothetical protein
MTTMGCMVDHIYLDKHLFDIFFLLNLMLHGASLFILFDNDCVHIYAINL